MKRNTPWKETTLTLKKRSFVARTQKLLYPLSASKQTFLMTLALLGNISKKIKAMSTLGKHSLASDHLVQQACIYISLGFDSISKGLTMSKVYSSPHCAVLGLHASGPFCCFSIHPEKRHLFLLFKTDKIMTLT